MVVLDCCHEDMSSLDYDFLTLSVADTLTVELFLVPGADAAGLLFFLLSISYKYFDWLLPSREPLNSEFYYTTL